MRPPRRQTLPQQKTQTQQQPRCCISTQRLRCLRRLGLWPESTARRPKREPHREGATHHTTAPLRGHHTRKNQKADHATGRRGGRAERRGRSGNALTAVSGEGARTGIHNTQFATLSSTTGRRRHAASTTRPTRLQAQPGHATSTTRLQALRRAGPCNRLSRHQKQRMC